MPTKTITTHVHGPVVLTNGESLDITSTGGITGPAQSIAVFDAGTISTLTSAGTITATYEGVSAEAIEVLRNTGTLSGNDGAVDVTGTIGALSNSGTIHAASFTAIHAGGDITSLRNTGTISGLAGAITANAIGSLTNGGVIIATQDDALQLVGAIGALTNTGLIEGGTAGIVAASGHITNTTTGIIAATHGTGIVLENTGTIENAGIIRGAPNHDAIMLLGAHSTLELLPGSAILGVVDAASTGDTLDLAGHGALTVTGIGTEYKGFATIAFGNTDATAEGNAAGLAHGRAITGFERGDRLMLDGFTSTSDTYVAGHGLELTGASGAVTLDITGNFSTADFSVTHHGGNTTIELCYLRGTRILTPTGEIPIEHLRIGDRVVTRFGAIQRIKWIGRQSYDTRFLRTNQAKHPVRIRAGALADNIPARDLYVSPGHAMLLDSTLVLARTLVNGVTITADPLPESTAALDYIQIELPAHDCVIAEGAWSETFADGPGLRAQFHNAGEYDALYPNDPPPEDLILCAPRPDRGPCLAAALEPIAARAAAHITPARLQGSIDRVEPWKLEGWALDTAHPNLPVLLDILLDTEPLGSVLACDPRPDLLRAGKGSGACAFFWTPPRRLLPAELPALRIRRAADAAPLSMTDACRAAFTEPSSGLRAVA